jgi:hypothetical protein
MFVCTPRIALLVLASVAARSLVLVASASPNPACPVSTVSCPFAVASTDSAGSCSSAFDGDRATASYDLISGTVGVETEGGFDWITYAAVAAADEYRVLGLPPGPTLSFVVEMRVRASLSGYCFPGFNGAASSASATLREGDSDQSTLSVGTPLECHLSPPYFCCAQQASIDQTLRVTILRSVGEVFTIHFGLESQEFKGYARVDGQLSFSGIPPGASVVSCQGYHQDFVTDSRRTSWGQLKLRYR